MTCVAFTISMLSILIQSQNHLSVGFVLELVWFFISQYWALLGIAWLFQFLKAEGNSRGEILSLSPGRGTVPCCVGPKLISAQGFPLCGVSQAREPLPGDARAVWHHCTATSALCVVHSAMKLHLLHAKKKQWVYPALHSVLWAHPKSFSWSAEG